MTAQLPSFHCPVSLFQFASLYCPIDKHSPGGPADSASSHLSSHLISSHLISSHLISSHLISSHLISSHLISSHLISSHLISSHLISSHLISSHLISSLRFEGTGLDQPHLWTGRIEKKTRILLSQLLHKRTPSSFPAATFSVRSVHP